MELNTWAYLETASKGFLSNVTQDESHIAGAVLFTASYDLNRYSDSLFERLEVPCPPKMNSAASRRKSDYLAGRALALAALRGLGVPDSPVTSAPSRAPVWPKGLAGSISHARGRCACLLSQDTAFSYGVDTEAIAQGKPLNAILSETLTPKDRVTVTQGPLPPAVTATLAFSAKEALFKALYPQVGRHFGFDAAELSAPPGETGLSLALTADLTSHLTKGQTFTLNTRLSDTHVLTWLSVPLP